jgi:succinate dehydrogenase / fumarate reductase cytochrome b subunit
MIPLRQALRSTVGKKLVMAITGLALTLFVITHLAGNLQLFLKDGTKFNQYAHMLQSLGWLLYVAEAGLLFFVLAHAVNGILIKGKNWSARGEVKYSRYRTKGSPSLQNLSTHSMIVSGLTILVFLVIHISHFKFGKNIAEGYVTTINGVEVRDLHRLVVETFKQPVWALGYMGVMVLLGLHLRHGFWSAFQSLGAMSPRLSSLIYALGVVLAILLALGFLGIPLWILVDPMGVYR